MNSLSKGEKAETICHETIFYAEFGGQHQIMGRAADDFRARVEFKN